MKFYDLDEIKRRADCVAVGRDICRLEIENNRCAAVWRGGDNKTAVSLSPEGFYDHKLKQGGSAIDLVMLALKVDINKAAELLGEYYNIEPLKIKKIEKKKVVAEYVYTNADGKPIHKTVRYEPKEFRQYRFCDGDWLPGLDDIQTYPYNLVEILRHEQILIHEGEKACECAIANGFPNSTTFPMGADKWRPEWGKWFRDKDVVVCRDNDDAGYTHGARVAWELRNVAKSIKLITPSTITKGDCYDFFVSENGTSEKLKNIIQKTPALPPESINEPSSVTDTKEEIAAKEANKFPFANYTVREVVTDRGAIRQEKEPRQIGEMLKDLTVRMMGFPKAVGGVLFDQNKKTKKIEQIKDSTDLLSWIAERTRHNPKFTTGVGYVSPDMLFSSLLRYVDQYELVSHVPHYPAIPNVFYSHGTLPDPTPDFAYFNKFCSYFCGAQYVDNLLIRVCVASLYYYEPKTDKPFWIIDTADGEGQGSGKTSLVEMLAYLLGGEPFWVDPSSINNDALLERIIKRLLSLDGRSKRIFLLDNIQNYFKSEALASIVTQGSFSGLPNYARGETSRINDLNFFATSNGGSFDRDLISRAFIIHLKKPEKYLPYWEKEVRSFVSAHRLQIASEAIKLMQEKPDYDIEPRSRFRTWERRVLQPVISAREDYDLLFGETENRKTKSDGEKERADILRDYFRGQIYDLGYDPDTTYLWLETPVLLRWSGEAVPGIGGRAGAHTTHVLRQLYRTGIWTDLSPHISHFPLAKKKKNWRGMMWRGDEYIIERQKGKKPEVVQICDNVGKNQIRRVE